MSMQSILMWVASVTIVTPQVVLAEDVGIRAPDGFQVTLFAGDDLAHNIHSMTIDSRGRVVVAGPGYVKILHDTDNDGKADEATMFSDVPKSGAHGMVFDGNDLICTGDNSLMKLKDLDGDGRADGKPEIWTNLGHRDHRPRPGRGVAPSRPGRENKSRSRP
jgi:hypothetical protein